jgi:hypothetical protein
VPPLRFQCLRVVRRTARPPARQTRLPDQFVLPYGETVGRLLVSKCKVMSSATKPLWLVFENLEDAKHVEWFEALDRERYAMAKHFMLAIGKELKTQKFIVPISLRRQKEGFAPPDPDRDWTARFNGSISTAREKLEAGAFTLPPGGVFVLSRRLTQEQGYSVYYHIGNAGDEPPMPARTAGYGGGGGGGGGGGASAVDGEGGEDVSSNNNHNNNNNNNNSAAAAAGGSRRDSESTTGRRSSSSADGLAVPGDAPPGSAGVSPVNHASTDVTPQSRMASRRAGSEGSGSGAAVVAGGGGGGGGLNIQSEKEFQRVLLDRLWKAHVAPDKRVSDGLAPVLAALGMETTAMTQKVQIKKMLKRFIHFMMTPQGSSPPSRRAAE